MSVVCDASAVIALLNPDDGHHRAAVDLLDRLDEDLVTTPTALAEMDFVVLRRGGRESQRALWANAGSGALQVRWWADALKATLGIVRQRPVLGLADASLVALADVLRTDRIFTFDQHFRDLVTPDGRTLQMLP